MFKGQHPVGEGGGQMFKGQHPVGEGEGGSKCLKVSTLLTSMAVKDQHPCRVPGGSNCATFPSRASIPGVKAPRNSKN